MNTEFVKESLKTEIELFKIYSIFVIALVSAIGGILLKDDLYFERYNLVHYHLPLALANG